MSRQAILFVLLVVTIPHSPLQGQVRSSRLTIPAKIEQLLDKYCGDCHGTGDIQADVSFAEFDKLELNRQLELLNKIQSQLFFKLMPPEEANQPSPAEKTDLAKWVQTSLTTHQASLLDEKLRYPDYGNFVDHDLLFGGEVAEPASTPSRRWMVSPQIFHEKVMDVFKLTGRDREGKKHSSFYGVTNPFLLPEHSGVRYYDIGSLDGGHLLVMIGNARWIADKQIAIAEFLAAGKRNPSFNNPKDRWLPRNPDPSYANFQVFVKPDSAPAENQLKSAIETQFDCVLQRAPTEKELNQYLNLIRSAIKEGGNVEGLRRMLIAVLLESEFLYRQEFGDGEPDRHGRMRLSPREATYAISYALGDRGPDQVLRNAAASGRLATKEDFRREVTRLLDDKNYYRGQIDPTLNGKHYRSNETSHPKIVRFFREFFGYPACLKVFKDGKRSEGKYGNPGRGSQATPGWLTLEADRIITWHIEKDENVFENLLSSDDFFVYHNKDNMSGRAIIEEWREVYERLKESAWKTQPEKVLADHLEFLQSKKSMRIKDTSRAGELVNFMHYFEESFGVGRQPFTTVPWAHGYTLHHSPFYSLPPTPSIGRYGSWKSTRYQDKLEEKRFWDYPPEQPFKIANRKGILTHPAWLIAHSTNFHSDPIRRGRWIREKLLAGKVPDVPITVDAMVPEDPRKTFRQRVELVTEKPECWKCHQHMNPLGMAFEIYDDFGRFRKREALEHSDNLIKSGNGKTTFDVYKTAPVVSSGRLDGTGDATLDGDVRDALDLIERLSRSKRVRQSIIRYAFRFFLGRNETPADSGTLIDADQAYVESNGSFRAVVISILTSDSFLYRKKTLVQ